MGSKKTYQLPADVAAQYELVNWPRNSGPEQFFGTTFRKVNVETLTLKQAERLHRLGFPYLKKIENKAASAKKEAAKDTTEKS